MNKNNKGFALVESLLVILGLAVIGFGGYYVWHNQSQKKVAKSNVASSIQPAATPTKTAPNSTTNYLTIKEWGVKLKLDSGVADALYRADKTDSSVVELTTKTLQDKFTINCYTATITRVDLNGYYGDPQEGLKVEQAAIDFPDSVKKVSNYYYVFRINEGIYCTPTDNSSAAISTEEQKTRTDLGTSFKSIVAS